jgi:hypothetical protein
MSDPVQISVVIPTYNRAPLITRAIESVLRQTRKADEIIVVDDGSTDDTRERVTPYLGSLRYLFQKNAGASASRNHGVEEARFPWVAFLDSDDIWMESHLERMAHAIDQTNGRAGFYFSDMALAPEEGGGTLWGKIGFHFDGPFLLANDAVDWVLKERQPTMLQSAVFNKIRYLASGGLWLPLRLTEPSWPVSWITYSTKYYWRVSASNFSGSSGWSSVYAFTSVQDTTQPSPPSANSLVNGDFITGTSPWLFYTSGTGTFDVVPDGCSTLHTARLTMQTTGANMQLYQEGITLQAGATYQLSFKGYSNTGHDVRVWIEKKGTPRTNYGLAGKAFDLGTSCAVYSAQFTAVGSSDTVHDARLLFWFSSNAVAGDQYFFDEVVLEKLNGVSKGLKKEGVAGEDGSRLPLTPTLVGNYPNPFNPSTLIEFQLPDRMDVEVTVFNTMGQRVAGLADGTWEAGVHRVRWEGADDHGRALASGIYYLRMHTDDRVQTKRMVLLK